MNSHTVTKGTEVLFAGTFLECWKYLVEQYGHLTVRELVEVHNIRIA